MAMLKAIVDSLRAHAGVHDWQVELNHSLGHQLFLVRERVESMRTVDTVRAEVKLYHDHLSTEGKTVRGEASFIALPQDDPSALRRKVEEAVFMAGLVSNPPFGLPGPTDYPQVDLLDEELVDAPVQALEQLREQLTVAVRDEPQVHLSSSECFITMGESEFRNSRSIETGMRSSHLLFDFVLISSGDGNESETHVAVQRRRLADLDVAELVARKASQARDALRGKVPARHEGPVVVSREAVEDMLAFFKTQTSAQARFQRFTQLELGESVFGKRAVLGEPLHLHSNALLPFGLQSGRFDGEGLPGQDVALIEDNVLQRYWAGQRYAEYLGVEPTGAFGNVAMPAGGTPMAELLGGGPLVHIVDFSDLMPNMVTGDVVAEIRLGYVYQDGQVTPIKGGALSTNLYDAFADAVYSQETIFLGAYGGPEAVRFGKMVLAGE